MNPTRDQPKDCYLGEEIDMLREAIRRVFELACECQDTSKASNALSAISQGVARLARLIQTEKQPKSQKQEFEEAYQQALDLVWKEMGIDDNPGTEQ